MSVVTDADGDLLGKNASDLMENVVLKNNSVSGTSKYVTGYTGFSSNVSEQSGNYIALKAVGEEDSTITAFINGGLNLTPVTLDDDGIFIGRLVSTATSITFRETTTDGKTNSTIISLANLTKATE